jgi:dTDP-4-dehydrorhamnose 3,5-epimerase-like enzyme
MKLQLKKFKIFSDYTGYLIPFYKNITLKNFNLKRFFFIYGKKKYMRADHAHKKCNQILIPTYGTIKVEVFNKKNNKKIFLLSQKNRKYLMVPKLHLIRLKFIKKDSILLTLCDYKYDKKEYIQSEEFFKS